jgi:hypothetical protein
MEPIHDHGPKPDFERVRGIANEVSDTHFDEITRVSIESD